MKQTPKQLIRFTFEDISKLELGELIWYYDHESGWNRAILMNKGLDYIHIKSLEGSLMNQDWKEPVRAMLDPDRFSQYIPTPPKRTFRGWLKKVLIKLLKKL